MKHTLEDCLKLMEKTNLSNVDTIDLVDDKKEVLDRLFDGYIYQNNNPTIKGFCDWVKEWRKKELYISVHAGTMYIDQVDDITNTDIYEYVIYKL